jgi:predicted PurR-regulated permease PerM
MVQFRFPPQLQVLILFVTVYLVAAPIVLAATDSTVDAGETYKFALPYILLAFGTIWSAILAWMGTVLHKRFGIQLQDSDRAALQTAAMNAAGRILHSLEGSAANVKIDVTSPAIAQEARRVAGSVGDEIKRLGYSPDRVSELIAGKIGQLQQGTAVTPTVHR